MNVFLSAIYLILIGFALGLSIYYEDIDAVLSQSYSIDFWGILIVYNLHRLRITIEKNK